jgi:glycine/D-amino acid oxidase-like deaminating enzyme
MAISRRTFLGRVAAVPLAARLHGLALLTPARPRIAVIGAGAFGGWIALQLQRRGAQVTLLDAWGPGNARSSSGGETRVIRAIYGPDRVYSEMVRRSYELWLELDPALYVETGALWMHRGDDGYVRSSVPILKELGFPIDQLSIADAARRYPQVRFDGIKSVWLERRAGALSARQACVAVRNAFVNGGGEYRTAHIEPGPIVNGSMTSTGIDADAYVFACGPWLGKLFPNVLGDAIQPSRQEVYFFGTPRGSTRYLPGQFPVWIDFGERIVYGVPDTHGRGIKIADDTRGEPVDPTNFDRTPTPAQVTRARALLKERFPELADAPLVESRVCQYENSPDGHLILDQHPQAKNVWLAGGGSGHGFKLAPAIGEMMASRILDGKDVPKLFRLDRLRDAKRATQFDTKS